jgi:hypothetical protein
LRAPFGRERVLGILTEAVEWDQSCVEEEVSEFAIYQLRCPGVKRIGEDVATYKTYHAASLEWDRVVQYSSIESIVSFAASRHLNTAKLSVLEELRSL